MAGTWGGFLGSYIFPLLGLGLLAVGSWFVWLVWAGARPSLRPPMAAQVAAILLGVMGGWFLDMVALPLDATHVAIGFPMPVMFLVKESGGGQDLGSGVSFICAFVNLAIGVALAHGVLRAPWARRRGRTPAAFRPAVPAPGRGRLHAALGAELKESGTPRTEGPA